jgi:hypothetical protein
MTIAACDKHLEQGIEDAEICMRDCGATVEELEDALGPHGWWRKRLQRDRDQQIHEVEQWLAGKDNVLH